MATTGIGLGTAFGWLGQAFALCRGNARVLLGAASMLMLVALLPTMAQVLVESALQPSPGTRAAVQAIFSVISLLLFPPAVGGFYRIAHALHAGRPARASDLFGPFQDRAAMRRLIVANLIFVVVSIVVIAGSALAFGGEALMEFLRAFAALTPGATQVPPLPDGLLPLLAVLLVLGLVIMTAQGLATAQVALTESAPAAAVAAGFRETGRHLGTFLLFYLPMAAIAFVLFMVMALVAVLVGALLSVASPTLAALIVVPLTLAALLVMYALLFTFFYYAWRDTLGTDLAAPTLGQIAV